MPSPQVSQQIGQRLEELYRRHLPTGDDDVASYYVSGRGYRPPEPRGSQPDRFGICLAHVDGSIYYAGDCSYPFAMQSISKVFAYGLALADNGRERLLRRVGVEPSGNAFNSLVFDERNNRPFNPMVNAGALATTDSIRGGSPAEKGDRILDVLRSCAGRDDLSVDPAILDAERQTADRNRATAYLMRSDGMLHGDVEAILSLYLQQCSVLVTCRDLAIMAATLANGGVNPNTGRQALPRDHVRDVLAVMYTCGMYDFAGEWAYSAGVPAKSGVSGGVLAVIPGKMGVGVFSPGLDRFGNSVRGTRVCQELSDRFGLHMFATDAEDGLLSPAAMPLPGRRRRHRTTMPCSASAKRADPNAGAGSDRVPKQKAPSGPESGGGEGA